MIILSKILGILLSIPAAFGGYSPEQDIVEVDIKICLENDKELMLLSAEEIKENILNGHLEPQPCSTKTDKLLNGILTESIDPED